MSFNSHFFQSEWIASARFEAEGVRRLNYWYSLEEHRGELKRFSEFGFNFVYCLAHSSRAGLTREQVIDAAFYGACFTHSKTRNPRVVLFEDIIPEQWRPYGLVHEGYHLKRMVEGYEHTEREEREALRAEVRAVKSDGLLEEYIAWHKTIHPSRIKKLRSVNR